MSRERQWLHDPMGPRRWTITGLCFIAVGGLVYLIHEQSRATSGTLVMVGAFFAFAGSFVEVLLRVRLNAAGRRGNPRR
jgi:nitrate/nitrite transporter NarK